MSQVDSHDPDHPVYSVYLSGDRVYLEVDKTLNAYLVSDLSAPIVTFPLGKNRL